MKKNILIIGTYPIKNPQHGGQKRLDAICREYKKAGFTIRYIAVFHKPFYADYGTYDIALPANREAEINSSPFTGDIVCGDAIYNDNYVKAKMVKALNDFKPGIIHMEQVFPYIGLKPLLTELKIRPKIIFGSQNIEYTMKEEMLNSLGYPKEFVAEKTKMIFETEASLSKEADLVAAVSEGDLKEHIKLGAHQTVLAPNGIYKTSASKESGYYWRTKFSELGVSKIVLFVGSAHPPNWVGFQDMVGRGLGFINADTRIVFAGSISEYAQSQIANLRYDLGAATFEKRAYFAGRLSEDKLTGLLEIADVILLPITEGGGSNLKTAEAITTAKKIVATDYAFRGFEELKHLPNIYTAMNPQAFRAAIIAALNAEVIERSPEERILAKRVLWPNCLQDLVNEVRSL